MRRAALLFVASALVLAGCGASAVIKSTTTAGSKFCNDVSAFANNAAVLTDMAAEPATTLRSQLPPIESRLTALQSEAPAPDTVNSKPLKTDIGTMASVVQDVITELGQTSDVKAALSSVNSRSGQSLTVAVGRFDDYAGSVCKVGEVVPGASTTAQAPTTVLPGPTTP